MNSSNRSLVSLGSQLRRTGARLALATAIAVGVAACGDDHHHDYFAFQPYDVPNSVVVADFNGDGVPDIGFAATHRDGSYPDRGFAGVILQNASARGTFQQSFDYTVGANPSTLAVGNLDAAHGPDLVIANANSANISVLLQDTT